jgi:hypothetical protein
VWPTLHLALAAATGAALAQGAARAGAPAWASLLAAGGASVAFFVPAGLRFLRDEVGLPQRRS